MTAPASALHACAAAAAAARAAFIRTTLSLAAILPLAAQAAEAPVPLKSVQINIVGGLANVSQYTRLEEPFWTKKIEEMSNGRIQAVIHPFDRSGLPGQEMLQLMRLGVVPFGTALLAVVAGDEPELNAVDLPGLNPNMAALRETVKLYRSRIHKRLLDSYGVELLAVYTYPAQVLFCARPFASLADLRGLRVRTSSVGQSEMMSALGATPMVIPFAEMVNAVRSNVVDCAITGTFSGNEIGLSDVTTHVSALAISWGLSFFGANEAAWQALPPDVRAMMTTGIAGLETDIWNAAERETAQGLACDIGLPDCTGGHPSHMTLVPVTPADEARRRRLLIESVLPNWVQRCGGSCITAWNETLGPPLGIKVGPD